MNPRPGNRAAMFLKSHDIGHQLAGMGYIRQAVDHWHPEAAKLLDPFRFIPNWRIDDLMVSFSAPGGGVGPHLDQYDVFIIQGEGKRHWRVGMPDASLQQLARSGVASLQVICPAFAVDCLETLEEIAEENHELFLQAGGKNYDYIPCLNDHPEHAALLAQLIHVCPTCVME